MRFVCKKKLNQFLKTFKTTSGGIEGLFYPNIKYIMFQSNLRAKNTCGLAKTKPFMQTVQTRFGFKSFLAETYFHNWFIHNKRTLRLHVLVRDTNFLWPPIGYNYRVLSVTQKREKRQMEIIKKVRLMVKTHSKHCGHSGDIFSATCNS